MLELVIFNVPAVILEYFSCMEKICKKYYSREMELLQTIPGISKISAMSIIAETSTDMGVFENSGTITIWPTK